jgi:hypothetical protein
MVFGEVVNDQWNVVEENTDVEQEYQNLEEESRSMGPRFGNPGNHY